MKIKFYGVRGSYPKPEAKYMKYGGNTPCVIIENEGYNIIFDAGTGIIKRGKGMKNSNSVFLFITHTHYDHIQGFPFFTPFFKKDININVYGPAIKDKSFSDILSSYMNSFFIPFSMDDFKNGNILIKSLKKNILEIPIGKSIVKGMKNFSHPIFGVYIFSYEYENKKIVYATDVDINKSDRKRFLNFINNADILIADSYLSEKESADKKGTLKKYGHSTFEEVLKIKDEAHIKNLYFFHYNPSYDDDLLDKLYGYYKKVGVFFSKEGEEVIL